MQDINALNARITALRRHYGLTQAEFASKIGISRSFLGQIEAMQSKPSVEALVGIAAELPDVSARWLLTGQGEMMTSESQAISDELAELRKLGRGAPQALTWRVLQRLEGNPVGLTVTDLELALQVPRATLEATLIGLKRERCLVLEENRYRLPGPPIIQALSAGDQGAAVATGIATLLERVLPGLETHRAGLLLSELHVADTKSWLQTVRSSMLELIAQNDQPTGHRLSMLLSYSVDAGNENG